MHLMGKRGIQEPQLVDIRDLEDSLAVEDNQEHLLVEGDIQGHLLGVEDSQGRLLDRLVGIPVLLLAHDGNNLEHHLDAADNRFLVVVDSQGIDLAGVVRSPIQTQYTYCLTLSNLNVLVSTIQIFSLRIVTN